MCAHDDIDSAEGCGFAGGGLSQEEECDPYSPDVSGPENELYGTAFLGQGLFCLGGKPGLAGDSELYPSSVSGRSPDRPVTVDVAAPLRGSRSRQAPLFRPH